MLDFGTSKSNSEVSKSESSISVENDFFLENYITSEGVVSNNVLYYQQLSISTESRFNEDLLIKMNSLTIVIK